METVLDKLHEPWSPATERVPASHPRNRISSILSDAIQQNHFTHTLLPGHKKAGVAKSLRHSGIGFVFIKNSGISAISYDSKLFHIYSFIITSNSGNFFNIYIKALTILEQAKPSPYGFTALLIAL